MAEPAIECLYDGCKREDLPRSQSEAIANGSKYYFSGKPCKRMHISVRYVCGTCIECSRVTAKSYYDSLSEEDKQVVRDRSSERNRRLYREEPEEMRAYTNSVSKKWKDANRTGMLYRAREKYASNPNKYREKNKNYRKANPEKIRVSDSNNRARRQGAEGRHTTQDIERIRKMQKDQCAHPWCRKKLHGKGHRDHIIPLAKGGTNFPRNIQLLCNSCNLHKHAKDPIDFAQENGLLL